MRLGRHARRVGGHALALLALVTVAIPAAAQMDARNADARLREKLDPETHASVMRVIGAASERGLPTATLYERALLGATYHRSRAEIDSVVRLQLERLELSRQALAPRPRSTDIDAGAKAIASGVPTQSLSLFRKSFPDRPLNVPLAVLSELVTMRVPVKRAERMVLDLMKRGASEAQLVALGGEVREDIAEGLSPEESFDLRTKGVIAALPPAPGAGVAADAAALSAPGVTSGGKKP